MAEQLSNAAGRSCCLPLLTETQTSFDTASMEQGRKQVASWTMMVLPMNIIVYYDDGFNFFNRLGRWTMIDRNLGALLWGFAGAEAVGLFQARLEIKFLLTLVHGRQLI